MDGTCQENGFVRLAPGCGPRHMVFHATKPFAYVVNELDSTVTVCQLLADGKLNVLQSSRTLPEGVKVGVDGESFAAAIRLSADDSHLYTSNRGHNSIAHFIVEGTGLLQLVGFTPCGGKWPRDIQIAGDYMLTANQVLVSASLCSAYTPPLSNSLFWFSLWAQESDSIASFKINPDGSLTDTVRDLSFLFCTTACLRWLSMNFVIGIYHQHRFSRMPVCSEIMARLLGRTYSRVVQPGINLGLGFRIWNTFFKLAIHSVQLPFWSLLAQRLGAAKGKLYLRPRQFAKQKTVSTCKKIGLWGQLT